MPKGYEVSCKLRRITEMLISKQYLDVVQSYFIKILMYIIYNYPENLVAGCWDKIEIYESIKASFFFFNWKLS